MIERECKICGIGTFHLWKHIKEHDISPEDYLVKWYFGGNRPKCKCGCGEYTNKHPNTFEFLDYVRGHHGIENFAKSRNTEAKVKEIGKKISKANKGKPKKKFGGYKKCIVCGTSFYLPQCYLKTRKTCSKECKKVNHSKMLKKWRKTPEGKKHSEKMRKRMSGTKNPRYGKTPSYKTYKYIKQVEYKNYVFKSSWEYGYARFLDENKKKWGYEDISYDLSVGFTYTPDFFVYDNNGEISQLVEIKGFVDDSFVIKLGIFLAEYPDLEQKHVVIEQQQLENLGIIQQLRNDGIINY